MEESLARMLVCSVMLPACARGRYTTPYAIVAFVIFLHLTELKHSTPTTIAHTKRAMLKINSNKISTFSWNPSTRPR